MTRRRVWLWITLFISVAILLLILATGWSVVLVRDYEKMVMLARGVHLPALGVTEFNTPWLKLILGSVGYLLTLGIIGLFFARLLREMKLNQLQTEFLARVTHELKTPIAVLELSASLLKSGGLTAEESERLWNSHKNELTRLRNEVESLLEAARLQSQAGLILHQAPIKLEGWLSESLERWRVILGPEARISREGEMLDCNALLDIRTFNLITDNLFDNAKKFSTGNPVVTVRTRRLEPETEGKPPRWQIKIEDEGSGFNPIEGKKIFRRFYRGRSTTAYAVAGTGLGLYLARTASRALGLKLTAFSPGTGKGAEFTIEGTELVGSTRPRST
jgi:two-component system phosphate regulon sensor histidine kinase PhoR